MRLRTFVVVPNSCFPDAAQAGVRGDVKDVESVAREGASAVEMAVTAAALPAVQTDAHVRRGAFEGRRERRVIAVSL